MNDDLDQAFGKLSAQEAYCARQRLAKDHASLFPTRLAMARWRSGVSNLHTGQPPLRAAWFARLGREHQAWLDHGGFTQHEELTPLRSPDMWHPPQSATGQSHDAHAQEQSISEQPFYREDRGERDGDDGRACGSFT